MAEETLKARATQKHLRRSPRKVRLVVDSVRGDRVDKALKKLEFTNKGAADEVAKVVKSAAANIRDKFQEARLDNQEIYISEIFVNEGATLKRIQPRAMGRANQIRKRTSHITVVVANNKELVNQ
ncbi:MAG: 50S ribosomal protein L22 [Aliifodinibius sp.]|jgi:large subunit ribosomal protein L22|nr:50S ribosomal protein L22 [candidate division KSB1 bacterium]NIT55354.1 50S ribosomal protein L22 [Fodinibius sp.]NIV10299.1 50S ribosomal protein L22 [Fodinibius sp.]NIY23938.1 50S ribosomal protein L22 [Fodinibius sp.]